MAMFAAGLAILIGASRIPSGFGYDAVGPAAMPYIIGGGFLASAILILLDVRRSTEPSGPLSLWPVAAISAALLLAALLVEPLGWVPLAALIFLAGALALGDRRIGLNAGIGLAFGVVTFVLFNWGLGLDLPAGVLAPVLRTFS
jgi:putative tricarboxylic transport membrane protein